MLLPTLTLSYKPPTISSWTAGAQPISTEGGATLTFSGDSFGPGSNSGEWRRLRATITAKYGAATYVARNCAVQRQDQLTCDTSVSSLLPLL